MLSPNTVLQGRYRIVRQLGQGGMGAVYEAVDESFDSLVALKETFFTDDVFRKQFEREARLLYKLRHAALTRVIDRFTVGDGHFLVMDFIPGEDLWEILKKQQKPFPSEQVLEWADQLLDALSYLHSHVPPIIHRDIKLQNLKPNAAGQITLLDFGLAKGIESHTTALVTTKSVLGYSLAYAPLEQILKVEQHWVEILSNINPERVKRILNKVTEQRTDLYSLGATLFHLLTGKIPPNSPARAIAVWSGSTDLIHTTLAQYVPVNVADIIGQSMALEVEDRIPDAKEMRKALRAALHEHGAMVTPPPLISTIPADPPQVPPIEIKAPPLIETGNSKGFKWPRLIVAGLLCVLIVSLVTGILYKRKKPVVAAAPFTLDHVLWHGATVTSVAFSPNGKSLISASLDNTIRAWDSQSGGQTAVLACCEKKYLYSVPFSPDGQTVAVGTNVGRVYLLNAQTGSLKTSLLVSRSASIDPPPGIVKSIAFSANGEIVASGGLDGHVLLWNAQTGQYKQVIHVHEKLNSIAFSPDGQTIATATSEVARTWNAQSGSSKKKLYNSDVSTGAVYSVMFSPDGKLIATGDGKGNIILWDAETGWVKSLLNGHSDTVYAIAFSPNGRYLASGSGDDTIRLWNIKTGETIQTFTNNWDIYSVAFSPDGKSLAGAGQDKTVKLWNIANLLSTNN